MQTLLHSELKRQFAQLTKQLNFVTLYLRTMPFIPSPDDAVLRRLLRASPPAVRALPLATSPADPSAAAATVHGATGA